MHTGSFGPVLSGLLDARPSSIGSAISDASRALNTAARVDERVERLALVCRALWSLASEKLGLTEEQLAERVKQIDLADGQADLKAGPPSLTCQKCGRTMHRRHLHCLYCGAEKLVVTAFDVV